MGLRACKHACSAGTPCKHVTYNHQACHELGWHARNACAHAHNCRRAAVPAPGAELANRGDRLQTEVHQVNIRAKYLKFMILGAHGEFATMNR